MNLPASLFLTFIAIIDYHVHGELTARVTMEIQGGDVVDCVDIHKQIGLTHPSLANHVIQMNPSWNTDADADRYGPDKAACPQNTVPMPRTATNLGRKIKFSNQHRVLVAYDDSTLKYGASAFLNLYNLTVAPDQFSSHNIWIQGNISGHLSMIIAGWRVDPQLFGDVQTRLFIYWTGDNYRNGCYNTLCAGFIQVDRDSYPGMVVFPTSTYGGQQFSMGLDVRQDRLTGNWWLVLNRKYHIGYWPKELLKSLQGGATLLAWGGLAKAGGDGTCLPLGNGHSPDASHKAMYLRDVEYTDSTDRSVSVKNVHLRSEVYKSRCYGLQLEPDSSHGDVPSYYLFLGGPGGCHCGAQPLRAYCNKEDTYSEYQLECFYVGQNPTTNQGKKSF